MPRSLWAYLLFFICCASLFLYAFDTGIIGIWPDLTGYADRTRHLLEAGNPGTEIAGFLKTLPLYSLFLIPAFALPDPLTGHQAVIAIQTLLLGSCFFPLRALLKHRSNLGELSAALLAALLLLSPFILPFTSMLMPQALFTALLIWFAALFDRVLEQPSRGRVWSAAVLLGLMLLTLEIGWLAWMAALLSLVIGGKASRKVLPILILPLVMWGIWAGYAASQGEAFAPLSFFGNNALARFNLIKNGLLYVLFGGLPLAGLAFLMCWPAKLKEGGRDPFFIFAFFCVLGAVVLTGFSTAIVVEKKLDFVFNRSLEPFLFLTAVIFLRLEQNFGKALLGNGVLILFVLMFFGLPYVLEPDFISGLAYWSHSMSNKNMGQLRNIMHFVLVIIPIIMLFARPKWFLPSYIVIAAIFCFTGFAQNFSYWSRNEDNNFRFMAVDKMAANPALTGADAVYAEFDCGAPSDISSVYRCFDLSKLLYFMPKRPQSATVEELPGKVKGDGYVLYSSSNNDTLLGQVVAQLGLARMMRVNVGTLNDVADTPRIHIKEIDGMTRYMFMPVGGKLQRMAMLERKAGMHLVSDAKGCAELGLLVIMNAEDETLTFELNGQKQTRPIRSALTTKALEPTYVKLDVPEGESELKLGYGPVQKADDLSTPAPTMMMFERPIFKPCKAVKWN